MRAQGKLQAVKFNVATKAGKKYAAKLTPSVGTRPHSLSSLSVEARFRPLSLTAACVLCVFNGYPLCIAQAICSSRTRSARTSSTRCRVRPFSLLSCP